ncbi:MAG: tellurite resistance TerB family protein [Paracoccaceae bacterium]
MFADFLRRLTAPDPQPLPEMDSRLALAALLVRIAKSDGEYAQAEIARIDRILAARFGVDPVAAMKLRARAEQLEAQAPDTVRFTRAIKDSVAYEDREGVVEALWEVVLADGERDEEEDALLRMVAPMLGVADQDSALARQRVEDRLDGAGA